MKKYLFLILFLSLYSLNLYSQESETTTEIKEVSINAVTLPTKKTGDKLYTGTVITKKGVEAIGSVANNNIFAIINIIPSVSTTTTDAFGLGQNTMRIRGVRSMFTGMTMEGVPNYGLSPIGAREDIYDKENLDYVALYKGAVPSDMFSGSGNRGGSIDLRYRRSSKNTQIQLNQNFGSNNFKRTFVRFDSGEYTNGETKTSAYGSFSYTDADKWKGFGKLATRKNFSLGIIHEFNDKVTLELFSTFNETFRNAFRPWDYRDIMNFDKSYASDYIENINNTPANDQFHYKNWKGDYRNHNSMLSLQYKPSENHLFSIKPYHAKEDALYNTATVYSNKLLRNNIKRDFWQAGIIAEYKGNSQNLNYSVGYWYEASDNQGSTTGFFVTPNNVTQRGKDIYIDIHGLGHLHNPYAKIAYQIGNFKAQAGLKYMAYRTPGSSRYLPSTSNPLVPEDQPTEDLNTETRLNDAFLPSMGIGYELNKKIEIYANYGKGYMRQYSGVTNIYLKNRAAFLNAKITLQDILSNWKTETSDNFDLGFIFNSRYIKFTANAFYTRQYNTMARIYNPKVNVNYSQNVGQLSGYGAELESYFNISKGLILFINPSYSKYSYNKNLELKTGNTTKIIDIKGKQSPAVPKFMLKSGLLYEYRGIFVNASANHTGVRYGDATNTEKVPEFTLFDATVGYKYYFNPKINISISGEVKNITDKRHVGMITFGDEQLNGGTGYFTGFPRTFVGSLRLEF